MSISGTTNYRMCQIVGCGVGFILGLPWSPYAASITALIGAVVFPIIFAPSITPQPTISQFTINLISQKKINIDNQGNIEEYYEGVANNSATLTLYHYIEKDELLWHLSTLPAREENLLFPFRSIPFDPELIATFLRSLPKDTLCAAYKKAFSEECSDNNTGYRVVEDPILIDPFNTDLYLYTSSDNTTLGWRARNLNDGILQRLPINFEKHFSVADRVSYLKNFQIKKIKIENQKLQSFQMELIHKQSIINPQHSINLNRWIISLIDTGISQVDNVASWGGHAMIVIEGMQNGNYIAYRLDLVKNKNDDSGKTRLFPVDPAQLNSARKGGVWERTQYQAQKILTEVQSDINKETRGRAVCIYEMRGQGALGVTRYQKIAINSEIQTLPVHNCMSWAKEKLSLANIYLASNHPWLESIAAIPREYTSPTDDKLPESLTEQLVSGVCNIHRGWKKKPTKALSI